MLAFSPLSFIANEVENLIAGGCSIQEAEMYKCTKEIWGKEAKGGEMFGAETLLILKWRCLPVGAGQGCVCATVKHVAAEDGVSA